MSRIKQLEQRTNVIFWIFLMIIIGFLILSTSFQRFEGMQCLDFESLQTLKTSQNYDGEIWNWYDLNTTRDNLTGNYRLMVDIHEDTPGYNEIASQTANGGEGWIPIGNSSNYFYGTFDGQGHSISDLFIDRSSDYQGFFGYIGTSGSIINVGIERVNETCNNYVGALVGYNDGTISNCYATGNLNGYSYVGGLIGWTEGTVSKCYTNVSTISSSNPVGGLVGYNDGTVSNCYATGQVAGNDGIGGLVGENDGTVSNCYATGQVAGNDGIGGLVGITSGSVSNCYANGNVSASGSWVGGLAGYNSDTVSNCYATGQVTGSSEVGGLLGWNQGAMSNCFWDTDTSGQSIATGLGSSAGGTGKTTMEMMNFTTFTTWNIITVGAYEHNTSYIWNIVDGLDYPFLSYDINSPSWEVKPQDQIVNVNEGEDFSYQVNATDDVAIDTYWLDNMAIFSIDATGLITNNIVLVLGTYWLKVFVNDTSGNEISVTFSITVIDITNPSWDIEPQDQTLNMISYYNSPDLQVRVLITYQVNATDNVAIDSYWLNDISTFSIDATGLITNTEALEIGIYYLEVFVNDTSGNQISKAFSITIQMDVQDGAILGYTPIFLMVAGIISVAHLLNKYRRYRNST